MSHVHRLHCDGCNTERAVDYHGKRDMPNGWFIVDGPYGGGEPYDELHACSVDCLAVVAHRLRIDDNLLPAHVTRHVGSTG